MPLTSARSVLKTPLDYMAESYWQDFLAKLPIAGGIAYEAALYQCALDESLLSLQRVDTLLSQIRRDLIKANKWNEQALLADNSYRNLLLFLAFYTGRVLAKQWQHVPNWFGSFELRERYAQLPLIADDFYQHMAVSYHDGSVSADAIKSDSMAPVFFALEPIGSRLFGHIDRPFHAVHGGAVASGLYQAVSELLPKTDTDPNLNTNPNSNINPNSNVNLKASAHTAVVSINNSTSLDKAAHKTLQLIQPHPAINTVKKLSVKPTVIPSTPITTPEKIMPQLTQSASKTAVKNDEAMAPTSLEPAIIKPALKVPPASVKTPPPTPEIFTQLLIELDKIETIQTSGNSEYEQARKILDQFEQHIAKQQQPRAQVIFSPSHQTARQKALVLLEKAATAGNTTAMLRLAMYELLGENPLIDKPAAAEEEGVDWVKQAANKQDSRAQRFLSKMYYQGVGVPQDITNGKYWLEQAAKNGHIEATDVVAQWQQGQTLITARKQEEHSFKRYQLLIGAVIIGALSLIIFV